MKYHHLAGTIMNDFGIALTPERAEADVRSWWLAARFCILTDTPVSRRLAHVYMVDALSLGEAIIAQRAWARCSSPINARAS